MMAHTHRGAFEIRLEYHLFIACCQVNPTAYYVRHTRGVSYHTLKAYTHHTKVSRPTYKGGVSGVCV